jgi:hypothetical protein
MNCRQGWWRKKERNIIEGGNYRFHFYALAAGGRKKNCGCLHLIGHVGASGFDALTEIGTLRS